METLEPSTTPAAGASEANPPASAAKSAGSSGPSSDPDESETPLGDRRMAVFSTESSRYSSVVSFAGAVLLAIAALRGERVGLGLVDLAGWGDASSTRTGWRGLDLNARTLMGALFSKLR